MKKTVTLKEAYNLLKKYSIDNAFAAYVTNTEKKSVGNLNFHRKLFLRVKSAERAVGIDKLKDRIDALIAFDLKYYNPAIANLYYKEEIPEIDKETVTIMNNEAKNTIKDMEAEITRLAEVTYIELGL